MAVRYPAAVLTVDFFYYLVGVKRLLIPLILLAGLLPGRADDSAGPPLQKLQVERLPDMTVPRYSPALTVSPDGSIYAFGGYAKGFVPLSSAEVFRDGKWRELSPMNYPHAGAFWVTLEDGRVMLGGGNAEAFGIGQTLGVEVFDPESGTFDPLGILPGKRVLSFAVTLPDSSAVVSGNWYAPDDVVLYTPKEGFSVAKPVTEHRSIPFMLPTSEGDVLIFGSIGTSGEQLEGWVDRLKGEPFLPPLFKEWAPLVHLSSPSDENALGGDAWLIPVFRRTDEQVAIAHVRGTDFSLLETDYPVPMTFPDGRPIDWDRLLVDRSQRKAYMAGFSFGAGLMVLVVDYNPALDGQAARLSLLYAAEQDGPFPYESHPVLLSPGRIAMVGGRMEDNFHPVSTVFVLNVGGPGNAPAKNGFGWWLLLLAACLTAALALWLFYSRRRAVMAPSAEPTRTDLLSRIISLMEERKLYLRKDLRIADVAAELGTNSTYVSACLNGQLGKSFNDFVSSYRVQYAQQLIQSHPQMPLDQVADESGFSSERSFYRIFKDVTGSSPGEWRTSPKNQFPR